MSRTSVGLRLARVGPLRRAASASRSCRRRSAASGRSRPRRCRSWRRRARPRATAPSRLLELRAASATDCVEAGAGNAQRLQRDVAFVEARDELAAHARGERRRSATSTSATAPAITRDAPAQRHVAAPARRAARAAHQRRSRVSVTRPRQNSATAAGTKVSDEQHRAEQRHDHGERHRVEHLSLDAGQRRGSAGRRS